MVKKSAIQVEQLVASIMKSGQYTSEADLLIEALKLLQQKHRLRHDIRIALDELDRGEGIDGDEVFQELRAKAADIYGKGV